MLTKARLILQLETIQLQISITLSIIVLFVTIAVN